MENSQREAKETADRAPVVPSREEEEQEEEDGEHCDGEPHKEPARCAHFRPSIWEDQKGALRFRHKS